MSVDQEGIIEVTLSPLRNFSRIASWFLDLTKESMFYKLLVGKKNHRRKILYHLLQDILKDKVSFGKTTTLGE